MVARYFFFRLPRFVFVSLLPSLSLLPFSLHFALSLAAPASYRPQSVRFVMPFLSFFYVTEFIWLFCLAHSTLLLPLLLLLLLLPSLRCCLCACLAAIRQKFAVSSFLLDEFFFVL